MKLKSKTLLLAVVMFGCTAASGLEPLITNQPASLNEMTAAESTAFKMLAPTSTNIPTLSPRHVRASTAIAQGQHERHQKPESSTQQTVLGEGKVVAINPNDGHLVIEHGEIRGFMGAMTMGYRVDSPSLLVGLKPGDKIRFAIDIVRRSIVKIEKSKSK